MPYAENLACAMIIGSMTLFVMSWDYVPPIYGKIKKVFVK